jgi:excisionase family DNA binding protein
MVAYSVKRLAEAWGCSRTTIYTMIEEGRLKAFPLGRRSMRITEEEKLRYENLSKIPEPEPKPEPEKPTSPSLSTHALKMIARGR